MYSKNTTKVQHLSTPFCPTQHLRLCKWCDPPVRDAGNLWLPTCSDTCVPADHSSARRSRRCRWSTCLEVRHGEREAFREIELEGDGSAEDELSRRIQVSYGSQGGGAYSWRRVSGPYSAPQVDMLKVGVQNACKQEGDPGSPSQPDAYCTRILSLRWIAPPTRTQRHADRHTSTLYAHMHARKRARVQGS